MTRYTTCTIVRAAILGLAALALLCRAPGLAAQCVVTSGPALFDSLAATGLPPHFRTTNDSMGISGSARRLTVRYNYGYVLYGLVAPGSPVRTSYKDLYLQDGYPRTGDGQTRTGKIALSADGLRALTPWTDEAGYGTIAQPANGSSFGQGGDYFPPGNDTRYSAVAKVGSRYLAFTTSNYGLYAADVTSIAGTGPSVTNGIPSEVVGGLGTDLSGVASVEAPGRTWVVAWSLGRVVVLDVSSPGASVPGLTSGFTWLEYSASDLGVPGGAYVNTVAAAAHPVDGRLHLLVEGYRSVGGQRVSTGVHLLRADPDTGALTTVGSFTPPTGENVAQLQTLLLPFDDDVVAFLFHKTAAGLQKLQVRSSLDFATNLAGTISPIVEPTSVKALVGFRSTGGAAHLYFANGLAAWAWSVSCASPSNPTVAQLAVDRVPATGPTTSVPDGGSVFIGDELRVLPSFTPPDAVAPLLDWRLDYDFHDGNAADSQAWAPRLVTPDASRTSGPPLPLAEYTLVGPCDPAQEPQGGSPPNPATGEGCWTSVTTNGGFGLPPGTPDFSASAPADRELKIAFEVRNASSQDGSSVATHRINWVVPRQLLKSGSVLAGGALEDGSEGNPAPTGFRWYFAQVPVGEVGDDELALETACAGPTCTPSFLQAGQTSPGLRRPGDYRYWVSVPYRGGFRTAECPGLDGESCTGDAAKTVTVQGLPLGLEVHRIGSGTGLVLSTPSGLSCGSLCSASFETGTTVTLEALPSAGSRFAGWSGSGCSGTGTCSVAMTEARRVAAAFVPESGTGFVPLAPCRVADTRSGAPLAAGEVRVLPVVASACGVPAGAVSAALNVTVTGPAAPGFLALFPAGAEIPGTQTVSFGAGRTRAAQTILLLGDGGAVSAWNASGGPVHVILDVSGVYE